MRVLALIDHYLPGYRMGGPTRTLSAMVEQLGHELAFYIVTSNHDMGVIEPYPNVDGSTWETVGQGRVLYAWGDRPFLPTLRRVIQEVRPDLVYLNSFFSRRSLMTVLAMKFGRLPRVPVLLAPRGEFAPNALALKSGKKHAYIALARHLRLYDHVTWHASSEAEAEHIRASAPAAKCVKIAPNLLPLIAWNDTPRVKIAGSARFIYLARVAPIKNLDYALRRMDRIRGDVSVHVYGPLEDPDYWKRCLAAAQSLPDDVSFEYRGEVDHASVADTLNKYHFLLLPTLGENFGHTIAEALQQGLPVVVSDRTPWRNLEEAGVGWDLSLEYDQRWQEVLSRCVAMDGSEYQALSGAARIYAHRWVEEQGGRARNLELFRQVATRA